MGWELEPGDSIRRTDLHKRYGGRTQGGIGPSRKTPNVLVFSDPESGEQHGYFDRWEGNEFHYAGEGQAGDQTLDQGNGTILRHKAQARDLRVFWGSKGVVQYAGEFEINEDEPYYIVDAPQQGSAELRKVVMFRLVPVGTPVIVDPGRPLRRIVRQD